MLIIENMSSANRKIETIPPMMILPGSRSCYILTYSFTVCFSLQFYVVKGNIYTYSGCLLVAYYPKLHCDKQTHEAFPVFWVIASSIQR